MSEMVFQIKREETIHYYVSYDRGDVIDAMAFSASNGDEKAEAAVAAKLEMLTDEELLAAFNDELDEYGALRDYIIEQTERYGDVQGNDVTVNLDEKENW